MTSLRERMLKNSGVSILSESTVNEKLKELEIKEKAERIISSFQREVLGLSKYISDGCVSPYYSDNQKTDGKLNDETIEKYKKLVGMFLASKVDGFKAIVADSFGSEEEEEDDDDDGSEGDEKEVTVSVAEVPQVQMAHPMEKHSNFNY